MAKLIEADALKVAIRDDANIDGRNYAMVKRHINEAEAVELVMCKDCKHTRKKNGYEQFMYNECVCICTKEDICGISKDEPVWDDGFCSYGERKTDG